MAGAARRMRRKARARKGKASPPTHTLKIMERAARNEKDARTSRYTQYAVADGTDAHL